MNCLQQIVHIVVQVHRATFKIEYEIEDRVSKMLETALNQIEAADFQFQFIRLWGKREHLIKE